MTTVASVSACHRSSSVSELMSDGVTQKLVVIAVEVLEVPPAGAAPGRFQIGQHRAVDLRELVSGQGASRATLSVEILNEPLGGRYQRRSQRIADRDRSHVALRVHPQNQPGAALIRAGAVVELLPLFGAPIVELRQLRRIAALAHLQRDDVDAVEVDIELAQPISDRVHR